MKTVRLKCCLKVNRNWKNSYLRPAPHTSRIGTPSAPFRPQRVPEDGDFDEAIKWQKLALESAALPAEAFEKSEQQLRSYAEGRPWRDAYQSGNT